MHDFVAYKYNEIKNGILKEIDKMMLPKWHPFLNSPNTPNSRIIDIITILKMILGENSDVPISLLHKCNGIYARNCFNKWYYYKFIYRTK